jgi:uncharacterized protein YwgA
MKDTVREYSSYSTDMREPIITIKSIIIEALERAKTKLENLIKEKGYKYEPFEENRLVETIKQKLNQTSYYTVDTRDSQIRQMTWIIMYLECIILQMTCVIEVNSN